MKHLPVDAREAEPSDDLFHANQLGMERTVRLPGSRDDAEPTVVVTVTNRSAIESGAAHMRFGFRLQSIIAFCVIFGLRSFALAQSNEPSNIIRHLYQLGKYEDGLPIALRLAEETRAQFGDRDSRTLATAGNVAEFYAAIAESAELAGDTPRAIEIRRQALAFVERAFGPASLETARALVEFAETWRSSDHTSPSDLDNVDVIADAIRDAIIDAAREAQAQPPEAGEATSARDLFRKDMEPAEGALRRALDIRQALLPPEHADVVSAKRQLGELLLLEGRGPEAQFFFQGTAPSAPALGITRPLGGVYDEGSQAIVYFGTNRPIVPGVPDGCERSPDAVSGLGYAIVDINAGRATPSAQEASLLLRSDARTLRIAKVATLDEEALLAEVRARLQRSQNFAGQAIVFVHGFNVSCDNAIRRAAQLEHDLGFDGPMLLYSWPSMGRLSESAYFADQEASRKSAAELRDFLRLVVKSGARTVHLIAHSMGNPLLLSALEQLQSDPAWIDLHIGQLILAAPDMDAGDLAAAVPRFRDAVAGITLYASASDRALMASGIVNRQSMPRAGYIAESGPLVVPGVETIDVTEASSEVFSLNHTAYGDSAALVADIGKILLGVHPPDNRSTSMKSAGGGTYWKYMPQ